MREIKMKYQTFKGVWKVDGYYDEQHALYFMKSLQTPTIRKVVLEDAKTHEVVKVWENPHLRG